MRSILTLGVCLFCLLSARAAQVDYKLAMSEPHTHYFEVEMKVVDVIQPYVDVKMPVWAPGSYLVREFSRNVEGLSAEIGGKEVKTEKINKNTWRIHSNKAKEFTVKYKVYAFEMSVRTSFLDDSHGYINGTSVFLFVNNMLDLSGNLQIVPYKDWKVISTGLAKGDGFGKYKYPNYDVLVDSPIEIGNHFEFSFKASGVNHIVAMYGEGNFDVEKLKVDMARIVDATTNIFGFNPNKEYVFIIHNLEQGSGGLEHANSTTLQVGRWTYQGNSYLGFLSLVAHEYFHLWNVKRIRPKELGPFDYENEAYTSLLWVMEGFTSYYDELILLRAGFYTPEQYLNVLSGTITSVENQPGNKVLPLSQASMDAWIKLYRPNENSYNTTISYYSKGACVAAMLDAHIISATDGSKGLDDVLVYMYKEYYEKQNRGFTEDEIQKAIEKVSGKKMDDFFAKYINGTEAIPYEDFMKPLALTVKRYAAAPDKAHLGIRMGGSAGKTTISTVIRNTSAFNSGLNVNDEIVAINGYRMNDQTAVNNSLKSMKVGDEADFTIVRDGQMRTIKVAMEPDPSQDYAIGGRYNKLGQRWLKKDFGG